MSALALSGHASRAPQCLLSGESGHRSNIRKCPNDPHQTAESLLLRSAQGSFRNVLHSNPRPRGKSAIAYATSFSTFANGLKVNHDPTAASSWRFPVRLTLPSLFARSIVV